MKKWKKFSLFSFLGFIVLVLGFIFYMVFIFEMFPVHRELLTTTTVPNKDYRIDIYYVGAGASTSGAIQLHKVYNSGKGESEIIKNIPRYNAVKDIKLLSDSEMKLVLGFKSNSRFADVDTVFVNIE